VHVNILGDLNIAIDVTENRYNIPLDNLFGMAARKNPKRSFLFVSKLLGKHIPVYPQIPRISGALLADLLLRETEGKKAFNSSLLVNALADKKFIPGALEEIDRGAPDLSKPTLFIGFAETATGLGHAMYEAFAGNAGFVHTTRDSIVELQSCFAFEEEHSHATSHRCYVPDDSFFDKFDRIVLVDDEITTGKTCLNFIKVLKDKYPGKEYIITSILDWRNHSAISKFEKLNIKTIALLRGQICCNNVPVKVPAVVAPKNEAESVKVDNVNLTSENRKLFTLESSKGMQSLVSYSEMTGRFGITSEENRQVKEKALEYAQILRKKRIYDNSLCMGLGEFIYLPSLIASGMGEGIMYQSTTRSPIHPLSQRGYPVKNVIWCASPEDPAITNYIYNVIPGQYREVFVFGEREMGQQCKNHMAKELSKVGIKHLVFVAITSA